MKLQSKVKQLAPQGTHTATCYLLADIGTQQVTRANEPPKRERQLIVSWELTEEKMEDGRPFVKSRTYKNSNHPKANIVKDMKAWLGAIPDDLKAILGKSGNVTIVHEPAKDGSGEIYDNFAGITALKKSEKAPPLVNPIAFLDMDDFSMSDFENLPEWIQNKAKLSPEYIEAVNRINNGPDVSPKRTPTNNDLNDDIPFGI